MLMQSPNACIGCSKSIQRPLSEDEEFLERNINAVYHGFELLSDRDIGSLDVLKIKPYETVILKHAIADRDLKKEKRQAYLISVEIAKVLSMMFGGGK